MKDTTKILLFGILMFFCASLRIWSTPDLPYHAFRALPDLSRWPQYILLGFAGAVVGACIFTQGKEGFDKGLATPAKSQASWCLILALALILPYACLPGYWIALGGLVVLGAAHYRYIRHEVQATWFSVALYLIIVGCFWWTASMLLISWLNQDWTPFANATLGVLIGYGLMYWQESSRNYWTPPHKRDS